MNKKDQDQSHAELYEQFFLKKIVECGGHKQLGDDLFDPNEGRILDFWEVGRAKAQKLIIDLNIHPDTKVVDYGCGSLRIGAHFINYLNAGNYCGLDTSQKFINSGIKNIGNVFYDKKPYLNIIRDQAIDYVFNFSCDILFSTAVFYHIHPNEHSCFINNINRVVKKSGAIVYFDCKVSDRQFKYNDFGWAWDKKYIQNLFEGYELFRFESRNSPVTNDYRHARFYFKKI